MQFKETSNGHLLCTVDGYNKTSSSFQIAQVLLIYFQPLNSMNMEKEPLPPSEFSYLPLIARLHVDVIVVNEYVQVFAGLDIQ